MPSVGRHFIQFSDNNPLQDLSISKKISLAICEQPHEMEQLMRKRVSFRSRTLLVMLSL